MTGILQIHRGGKVDFSNTVIIMTSNAGAKAIVEPKKLGFATKEDPAGDYKRMKQNVMDEVKMIFPSGVLKSYRVRRSYSMLSTSLI